MSVALLAARPRHRPGGWTPKELGTLSLWLDADDATTVTISTGVSQWDDKSGNARHMTQAVGASQPSRVTGGQNGRAALRFDGTNHQMTAGDVLDLGTGGLSVVAAFKNNANSYVLTKASGGINANGEWAFAGSNAEVYMGGVAVATLGTVSSATKVLAWVVDRSAGSTVWSNGAQLDTDTASPFPNTDSLNTAAALNLGGRDATTALRFNGDMFEVVASLSALSTDDRQRVEGYLAHKWGTTASLPSDHPWKAVAP